MYAASVQILALLPFFFVSQARILHLRGGYSSAEVNAYSPTQNSTLPSSTYSNNLQPTPVQNAVNSSNNGTVIANGYIRVVKIPSPFNGTVDLDAPAYGFLDTRGRITCQNATKANFKVTNTPEYLNVTTTEGNCSLGPDKAMVCGPASLLGNYAINYALGYNLASVVSSNLLWSSPLVEVGLLFRAKEEEGAALFPFEVLEQLEKGEIGLMATWMNSDPVRPALVPTHG